MVVVHVLEKEPDHVTRNHVRKFPKILQLIVNGVHGVPVMLNVVRAIKLGTLNNLPFLAAKNVREETDSTVSKNHVLIIVCGLSGKLVALHVVQEYGEEIM